MGNLNHSSGKHTRTKFADLKFYYYAILFSQISHKKHKFAFGSLVQDSHMLNPTYTGYQNLFYEFFNWATVGSYKWKYNQGNRVSKHLSFNS